MDDMKRLLRELSFLTAGIVTSLAAFVIVLVLLAFGTATLVVWIGVPVLVAMAACARWFADLERSACDRTFAEPLPPHAYRPARKWWSPILDPQVWRDVIHAILGFAIIFSAGIIAVSWTISALGGVTFAAWEWALPRGDVSGLFGLITGNNSRVGEIVVNTGLGLLMLVATPVVVRVLAAIRLGFSRALLTSPASVLRARAEEAEASRTASNRAESHTLSMIERSIHDGPQQRLVRLTMDLQAAQRRMQSDDPAAAASYLDEAVEQSREVLAEMRAVSRGIAPPVLSERGLVAAVVAAASRCPVDTVVDTDISTSRRYDGEVEAAAYFVVAEALTNVAKHSGANHASVAMVDDGSVLCIRIEDDGIGGAHVGKGHGLAGLEARVTGIRGQIEVVSPVGGPTTVTAAVPRGTA